jgi:GMP synthase-like glutamine amidotransferase
MRIVYLQHEEFEDPAYLLSWARKRGHAVRGIRVYEGEPFPELDEFNFLWIMGGAMGVHDTAAFPWLGAEKDFIRRTVDSGKRVLGICLGAQLLADVLGALVFPNPHQEIGWFSVRFRPEARTMPGFGDVAGSFTAFHWHRDTFDVPPNAVLLAGSEACANQGFAAAEGRVLALQFHPEATIESVRRIADACGNGLNDAPFVQNRHDILVGAGFHARNGNRWLDGVLDGWIASWRDSP